jgi:HNH endonuclease
MTVDAPSESAQLQFLTKLQRLVEEGQFTATYKFALLSALVDIAVERGRDDASRLRIPLSAIAEKFAELYWGHTKPFRGGVLSQNKGRNIAMLGLIEQVQGHAGTVAEARRCAAWHGFVNRVAGLVVDMPLFKLQRLRNESRLIFLYEERIQDHAIELLDGVAFCLRQFSGFIRLMVRSAWLSEIRRNARNAYLVGDGANLEVFLFGDDRVPLGRVREILLPIQSGRCFYCGLRMDAAAHVDHFIPYALYPGNQAHNLVLAHAGCNGNKSDLLADIPHLERWVDRNHRQGAELAEAMEEQAIVADLAATEGIARWAYHRADEAGALLWIRNGETRQFPRGVTLPI